MKKLMIMGTLLLMPFGLVFGANENGKLDQNARNSTIHVGVTTGETKRLKCSEDGYQLFKDGNYETKVSTSQAGRMTTTSNVYISSTTMLVTGYEMISVGSVTPVAISGVNGTVYVPASQRTERRFEVPVSSFSFSATLTAGSSFYYRIDGIK